MKKQGKRTLAFVLSLAMMVGTMAIAATSASADGEAQYSTVTSWSTSAFNDMAGNGLTTAAPEGTTKLINSDLSIGACGYGIYGYVSPSSGNTVPVVNEHVYRIELQINMLGYFKEYDEKVNSETGEPEKTYITQFGLDCYAHTVEQTWSTGFSSMDYDNAVWETDPTYGYTYKTVSGSLTAKADDGEGEFRAYTRGFADYICYRFKVYDETAGQYVVDVSTGDGTPMNDADGIRDPENYRENDNFFLPKGLHVAKTAAAANTFANTLVVGGMKYAMTPGNYQVAANVKVADAEEGDLYTIKVLDSANAEVASKTMTYADIKTKTGSEKFDSVNATMDVAIAAAGDYTIAYYVNDKATLTLQKVDLLKEIDAAKIANVVALIDAIPDSEHLTEENLAAAEAALAAAEEAVNALIDEYGSTVTKSVSNYADLNAKKVPITALRELVNDRTAAADNINGLIDAVLVATEDVEDQIATIDQSVESFCETYSVDVADSAAIAAYISKYPDFVAFKTTRDTMYGDVTGDKVVDASDALLVLQFAVNKIDLSAAQQKAANVTKGDETIDASDALLILQKAVNKITVFPVEEA